MRTISSLRRFRPLLAVAALACPMVASQAQAVVIAYEDFESYVAGSALNGQSGGTGWSGNWTGVAAATVQPITLVDPSGLVSGGSKALRYSNATTDVGNAFSRTFAPTSDTLYVSYQLRVESFEDGDFLSVSNSDGATNNSTNTLSTGVRNQGGNPIFTRVATNGSGDTDNVTVGPGSTVPDATDFLVVAKYSKVSGSLTYNRTEVYVNPVNYLEPVTPSAVSTDSDPTITQLSMLTARVLVNETNDTVYLDSFRAATSFAEALGATGKDIPVSFAAAADAHVQSPQTTSATAGNTNFGQSTVLQIKNGANPDGGFDRKAWIRFEAPQPGAFEGYANAEVLLTVDTANTPGVDGGTNWTFALYGLKDDAANQLWPEGNGGTDNNPAGEITWNNAPGNVTSDGALVDLTQMFGGEELATFEILGRGTNGTQILLDDQRILDFIQSDTDGLLSFILVRSTLEDNITTNSVVHQFRSGENTLGGGPTLRLYGAIIPEPSVAILSLMGMAVLGLRRRRTA